MAPGWLCHRVNPATDSVAERAEIHRNAISDGSQSTLSRWYQTGNTLYKMYSEAGEFITQNNCTRTDYRQCKNRHQVSNFIFTPLQAQKLKQPYV